MAEVFRLSFVLGCEKKHKTQTHTMIRQGPEWKTAVTRMTPEQHRALDQAAAWIARLRADDVSAGDRAQFACWLSEDVGNAAAFDRMLELWSDLGVLRALPIEIPRTARARRWQLPLGLAAAAAVVALLVLPRGAEPPALELRTPVGGFRQVRLEDGSEITLNTDTALSVALRDEARTVTMDHGEVFFSVAPDAARPFSAVCGEASVTVLGTAFGASCDSGGMSVVVAHGRVRFATRVGGGASRELGGGDAVRYDRQDNLAEISRVDPDKALAWQQRRLVFEDVPLAEVIGELQRYMEPALRIADPAAGTIRVSGVFSTAEPRLTLAALEKSLGLAVTGPEQGPLLISRRTD